MGCYHHDCRQLLLPSMERQDMQHQEPGQKPKFNICSMVSTGCVSLSYHGEVEELKMKPPILSQGL
jgi:hypothetical protein